MKKFCFLILLGIVILFNTNLLYAATAKDKSKQTVGEQSLKKWGISFSLPADQWYLVENQENDSTKKAFFMYNREALIDSKGNKVIPVVGIILEEIEPEMDPIIFSIDARMKMKSNFGEIKSVFYHDDSELITLKKAIGYICENKDANGKDHTLIWVHSANQGVGMQVIMDVTTELYPTVKNEFEEILKSFKEL